MHELSVCVALLDQVQRIAHGREGMMVVKIVIKLGPLSGVESQLLRHAYPLAAAGTVAERAELIIDACDVVIHCGQCGTESRVTPNRLLCLACGDFRTRIVSGDEMILQSVELDRCDETAAKLSAASTKTTTRDRAGLPPTSEIKTTR